jgi:two-component system, sensor histidine kinase and response regulator
MARLVVIDDDQAFLEMLRDILVTEGYEVRAAADGSTGLALAREWKPDVVLCDLHMEGLSGHDVLRVLRQDPSTASVPVMFVTGDSGDAVQRQTMELGADDFIGKPFQSAELVKAIQARLARREQIRRETERRLADLREGIMHSVPHEFLTPLTAVIGLSSLLVDEGSGFPSEAAYEAATGILAAGRRLHHLVEKFLLFTELELLVRSPDVKAGRQAPRPTVDAATVVAEAAQRWASLADRGADLEVSAPGPMHVRMSRDHLTALVGELVENACTFSSPRTPVRVTLARRRDGCFLTVENQGRGMTREQIEGLGAFVQFDRRRMEQPGTGLGLAIVVRIAELAGGAARIESVEGKSTTAIVRLPSAEAAAPGD